MAETNPALPPASETPPRKPMPWQWILGGPMLVVAVLVSGKLGWEAWKHHQFEKERTETAPLVVPDLKLKLLWIPAGTFTMGTEDEAKWVKSVKKKYNGVKPAGWPEWKGKEVDQGESPATMVTLTIGFYLGETEVTQAQWEAVMGSNPSKFEGPNRLVENVCWDECVLFCQKLTQRERAAGHLGPKQVYRLPTGAEWEYACRAAGLSGVLETTKASWVCMLGMKSTLGVNPMRWGQSSPTIGGFMTCMGIFRNGVRTALTLIQAALPGASLAAVPGSARPATADPPAVTPESPFIPLDDLGLRLAVGQEP